MSLCTCIHAPATNCREDLVLLGWMELLEMQDLKDQAGSQASQESKDQKETREKRAKRVAGDQLVHQETEDLVAVMALLDHLDRW